MDNKVILITGGTGSFGKKAVEMILDTYSPKAIRIFSRGELKQYKMQMGFKTHKNKNKLRYFIGDVRDEKRLLRATKGVDIIIHAAALKQVPICEYNPDEAIKTNISGTINVINAAIENNVEKAIFLSSDKAVHPVNLYGATKLAAEKLFIQSNSYTSNKKTRFSCVRYGNVMGSRGSVIPMFQQQKEKGIITITDKNMTRFWITLEHAVNFVFDCVKKMEGGEIYIPKLPSMHIIELAKAIAPNCKIKIVGIRPGEKINEILFSKEESLHVKQYIDYFVIEPIYDFWKKGKNKSKPSINSEYASNTNDWWLKIEDMRKILKENMK